MDAQQLVVRVHTFQQAVVGSNAAYLAVLPACNVHYLPTHPTPHHFTLCRTLVTMVFATLGFLSPANRGGLMTAVLLLFVFMGCFAGYSSARLYKAFKVGCQRAS